MSRTLWSESPRPARFQHWSTIAHFVKQTGVLCGEERNKAYTPNPPICVPRSTSRKVGALDTLPKRAGDHHRSRDKEHGKKSPFPLYFSPWTDSLPAWLSLGWSLTIAVEEREHHVAHVVRELHLGHCPGHLLHGHCNRGRAQGHRGVRMC